jgi:hypothetical protein
MTEASDLTITLKVEMKIGLAVVFQRTNPNLPPLLTHV